MLCPLCYAGAEGEMPLCYTRYAMLEEKEKKEENFSQSSNQSTNHQTNLSQLPQVLIPRLIHQDTKQTLHRLLPVLDNKEIEPLGPRQLRLTPLLVLWQRVRQPTRLNSVQTIEIRVVDPQLEDRDVVMECRYDKDL